MSGPTRLKELPDRWEDHFEPGETLLWRGAPAPGLRVTSLMIFLTLFALPFVAAGLGLSVGPWYAAVKAHDNIRYALSDRRDSEGGPVRERTGFHHVTDGRTVYDLLRQIQTDQK